MSYKMPYPLSDEEFKTIIRAIKAGKSSKWISAELNIPRCVIEDIIACRNDVLEVSSRCARVNAILDKEASENNRTTLTIKDEVVADIEEKM